MQAAVLNANPSSLYGALQRAQRHYATLVICFFCRVSPSRIEPIRDEILWRDE